MIFAYLYQVADDICLLLLQWSGRYLRIVVAELCMIFVYFCHHTIAYSYYQAVDDICLLSLPYNWWYLHIVVVRLWMIYHLFMYIEWYYTDCTSLVIMLFRYMYIIHGPNKITLSVCLNALVSEWLVAVDDMYVSLFAGCEWHRTRLGGRRQRAAETTVVAAATRLQERGQACQDVKSNE